MNREPSEAATLLLWKKQKLAIKVAKQMGARSACFFAFYCEVWRLYIIDLLAEACVLLRRIGDREAIKGMPDLDLMRDLTKKR